MPESAKRPSAQRDQLAMLWDKVIGNGRRGMVDDVAEMKVDVAYIRGKVDGMAGTPGRRTIVLRRLAETAATTVILGLILSGLLLLFTGRLEAGDIAEILRAWKGAP